MRSALFACVFSIVCAVLVAGCTHNAVTGETGRHAWTVPGTIRLGEPDEPDSLNPMFGNTEATDRVDGLIFSFLLRYDADGKYIPDLATRVPSLTNGDISADGTRITVHMRAGVTWSDGAPLTARDWLFTYHTVMNPRNPVKTRFLWDDIAHVRIPDDRTIVITLKRPNASFLGVLAMGGSAYPPLPEHVLAALPSIERAPFNNAPISSGPYLLESWHHGSTLTFVPNPRYFRGAPALAHIIWNVVPDNNTLFNELRTHEIDVYPTVNEAAIAHLREIDGITVTKRLIATWRHLGINTRKPLLADIRVRRAIALGIDWQRINDAVYRGYNQLAVSDIFPGSWAAPHLPPYRYDPNAARTLLRDAGWILGNDRVLHRGDRTMHLTISTGTNKAENQAAEVLIQSMLRPLGFDIQIRNYPISLLFAQNGPIYGGTYDLEWSVETNGPDPDNSGSWNGAYIPPNGANTSWLNDPAVNRLSDAAIRTYDVGARTRLYQREEERLRALVPAIPLYWENSVTAFNSDVKQYKPAAYIADTWNAWEWRI